MRNLKRALSLTLASVMLLGMMVVGSSAAAGYDDVKETDNVEAIEVLQTVGIMVGDERGFGPDRPVNRAEMAVIMGLLLNLDYNYYTATCPFNDVYDWARGWVGACAANGIVSGRGDGVYDPGATVTAVEAASMLMRALGYFKYASDYANGFEVSTVLQGNTIGIFDGVGSSATEPMTRNQVAQMVLNTLQSGMVQPDGNTLNYFDNNGQVIATSGKVNYVYVTSNKPFAKSISSVNATSMGSTNTSPIVELGEQLYNGELKLYGESEESRFNTRDVFGRPARQWEYQGKEIGTYVKKELLKQDYTVKVTGADLYNLLGKATIDKYNFVITIDGVEYNDVNGKAVLEAAKSYFDRTDLYRTNKDGVGGTGKGVLTEVFVDTEYSDSDDYTVFISVINTYLAKAKEDYDTKDDDVRVDVYAIKEYSNSKLYYKYNDDDSVDGVSKVKDVFETITIDGDDFDIKDVKDKDLFLVRVADGDIQEMVAPEIVSKATINAFSRRDWVNLDGNQYDYASTARYDVDVLYQYDNPNLKDITYNVILDKYGYAIGLERNEDPDQYVFLTGIEDNLSNLTTRTVDANIIHLDGTMSTVQVNMKDSFEEGKSWDVTNEPSQANTWCTYRVDSNGVYTLEEVHPYLGTDDDAAQHAYDVGATTRDIDNKHITLPTVDKAGNNTVAYGNDKTVYLNVELDEIRVDFPSQQPRRIIDDVTSVNTGHRNVKISVEDCKDKGVFKAPANEIYTLYDDDNYVIAVVTIGEDEGVSSNWVYVNSKTGRAGVSSEAYNGNTTKAANDGKWTWTREVILNGKKTELKEVGSDLKWLDKMNRGEWYEIKYDADGNVRRTEHIQLDADANKLDDGYVGKIEDVATAVTKKDTVLFSSNDFGGIENLEFNRQGTLYVKNDITKGFAVAPDVKVVLALASKAPSASPFDDVVDTYEGYDGLRDALNDMNIKYLGRDAVKADWDKVELNAILVNNSATVIVINDKNPAPNNKPGAGDKPVEPEGDTWTITFKASDYTDSKFYVNNELVPESSMKYAGSGNYSFTVKKGATVEIFEASLFTGVDKAGTYTDEASGVVYTATADQSSVSFTASKNITVPAPADIVVEDETTGGGDGVQVKDTAIIEVKGTYADKITGYHILTSDDVGVGGAYNGVGSLAANDLAITFTLAEGETAVTDVDFTVQWVDSNGIVYTAATVSNATVGANQVGTSNDYVCEIPSDTDIDGAAGSLTIADLKTSGGKLTVTANENPVAPAASKIQWVNQTGLTMVGGTTTGNVNNTSGTNISLVLGDLGAGDEKISLTYKVANLRTGITPSGTANADGSYTVECTGSVSSKQATFTNLIAGAKATEGQNLVITLVSYKVTQGKQTVTYTGDAAAAVDTANAATDNLVSKAGGQDIDFVIKASSIPAGAAEILVDYEISGIAGTVTPVAAAVADPMVISNAGLTVTGPVTVTVKSITVTKYSVNATASATLNGITMDVTEDEVAATKNGTSYIIDSDDLSTLLQDFFSSGTSSAAAGTWTITFTGAKLSDGAASFTVTDGGTVALADLKAAVNTALAGRFLESITGEIGITVTFGTT